MPILYIIIAYLVLAGMILAIIMYFGKKNRELDNRLSDLEKTCLKNRPL